MTHNEAKGRILAVAMGYGRLGDTASFEGVTDDTVFQASKDRLKHPTNYRLE